MAERAPRISTARSPSGLLLGLIVLAALASAVALDLDPHGLLPNEGGWTVLGRFLAGAVSPATAYEAGPPTAGAEPFLWGVLRACRVTVLFAAAAVSLALLAGLPLAFLAASRWWWGGGEVQRRGFLARGVYGLEISAFGGSRLLAAVLRSMHELLWAVLFLAALGRSSFAAVLAIAVPYTGTFAKVFSEMLDETRQDAAEALTLSGASRLQAFLFGLLPRALPDLGLYAFYRFECAVRSSAVLGFFGFPTLGYFISASIENLHYREVWTYLYAVFVLVLVLDLWSGALRRRLVA